MSERNIEALKEVLDAFNSGDIERVIALVDPDFEGVVPPEFSAEPDTYRGHDGIRRYFRTWDGMEEVRFHPERFWDAGDAVVATVRLTAKGRLTSIAVEQRIAQVWRLREGRALSAHTYASLSDALSAAGLGPDAEPL